MITQLERVNKKLTKTTRYVKAAYLKASIGLSPTPTQIWSVLCPRSQHPNTLGVTLYGPSLRSHILIHAANLPSQPL
ncbi:hypothetical protein [Thaumasiovibrio subtropicus]|uniref:hypothetical protein n=1 Tax=Thaumasiovibrio subtropicus TaxID=1891207 RepID=UPI00131DA1C7|nr:hypothetical protein [Thaumasiovibrio subtropicus]